MNTPGWRDLLDKNDELPCRVEELEPKRDRQAADLEAAQTRIAELEPKPRRLITFGNINRK